MIQRHQYEYTSDLNTKFNTSSLLSECVKQQQLNTRTCSDFDLHNLSYTISPSVDHSFSYYSSNNSLRNFNTPAYSYVSDDFLNNLSNGKQLTTTTKPSHSSLTYSPIIDRSNHRNYLDKIKRKQLFVNKSEMQCNQLKMINSNQKLSNSAYFDPESLVSFTLQSNAKKANSSKSTPCLNTNQLTSPNNNENSPNKTPKSKRKTTINWPFRRSNSSSTVKQPSSPQSPVPLSIQQHKNKTVSMFHKKLLSKSQSNLKNKSQKSTTLSLMSNVTLKRSSNKKQTIKLFGQPIGKLCLGDRHLIAPVKNMLVQLAQRAPQTVGIFRKSANARVCRELKVELEQNPDCNLSEYPIIVIASVFKELLRSLPDSVLVDKVYQKWLQAAKLIDNSSINNSDCSQFIRPLIKSLPKANYLLLQHFLCILHHIAIQSNENKMSAENLAVCIGPSLLNHDISPASQHCELSKQVPKLISYLIKNCVELFGANTLTLFDPYIQNKINEDKENQNYEEAKLNEKSISKDSGAEESDSLNSLNELNNNINGKQSNNQINLNKPQINSSNQFLSHSAINANLFIKDNHLLQQPQSPTSSSINTFSTNGSFSSSTNNYTNSTPKTYQHLKKEQESNCSSNSIASSDKSVAHNDNNLRLPTGNSVHQTYYVPMLGQQTSVNKVSLSNLSRDSGLTLSDTQLYSPEEDDDEDDYHHIINQHLHLNKKINNIVSDKCLSNKNQFKINSSNKKIATNSTTLKKKCNKINTRANATSSEDDLELDDDHLSEKSCASENCALYNGTQMYSRVYNKHNQIADHHLLTKSAPQLANIEAISHSIKDSTDKNIDLINQKNQIAYTTIPLYLHTIKTDSLSTNSTTNSSCNSPASNLSSTSLNLSSSNEYTPSESLFTSTPISSNLKDDLFKDKHPHIVTISAKDISLVDNQKSSFNNQNVNQSTTIQKPEKLSILLTNNAINSTKLNLSIPPSYQETMNRKELNARMANLAQSNASTSRKISSSEIDNLISNKIYEESLRVYNSDAHKDLKLRAVPAQVKIQSSSESDTDSENHHFSIKSSKLNNSSIDQVDGLITPIKCKPLVQQRCAKNDTEYWKKDVNWSVATLRKKYTELCEQKESNYSNRTLNRISVNSFLQKTPQKSRNPSFKSTSSIYDLCKTDKDQKVKISTGLSQSSQLLDNKNGVTVIQIMHGKDKPNQADRLNGVESYV